MRRSRSLVRAAAGALLLAAGLLGLAGAARAADATPTPHGRAALSLGDLFGPAPAATRPAPAATRPPLLPPATKPPATKPPATKPPVAAASLGAPPADGRLFAADPFPAGLPREFTNSLGMKFVLIPAGWFKLGGQNYVRLTEPYYLAVFETTNAEYQRFVREAGHRLPQAQNVMGQGKGLGTTTAANRLAGVDSFSCPISRGDRNPVVCVAWDDATAFCAWLSALPAERAARRAYTLPSETEWELAYRAGTASRYYWSDDEDVKAANYAGYWAGVPIPDGETWEKNRPKIVGGAFGLGGPRKTLPVGSCRPNAWGLYDMAGNAWEWCLDFHSTGFYENPYVEDPTGPPEERMKGGGKVHVRRGGSCESHAKSLTAVRPDGPPYSDMFMGFRVRAVVGEDLARRPKAGTPRRAQDGAAPADASGAAARNRFQWRPVEPPR